ncbi:hypothetical protein HXX76_010785 [Chlamydomonas incerta]|uniref:Uncharacterized protein n=1 Tax=Chlamydomonas incerta TaxID=51695 RepID=A0A835VVL4_CHLIN|nr:hypothetical protein HXX76_010785 [Chlamydomonas incerta]|eukprot:KAG2429550.1 hypothetical protein HXX76_010785 [Chlamydomonas incerta]
MADMTVVVLRDNFEAAIPSDAIWSAKATGTSGLIAQAETCGMQLYGGGAFKFAAGAYRQLQPATYPANASFELFINRVCPGDYSGETRLLVEYSTDDEATWYTAWVWAVCRDCYNYWQRLTFNLPFEEDTFALLRFRRDGNDKGSLLIDRLGFTILLASGAVPPPPPAKAIPPSPPPQPLVAVTRRDGFEQGQKGMDMTIWSPFAAGASGLIAQAETCGMQLYGGGAFKFAAGAYRQLQPATYPANASFELFINRVCPGDYSGETRLLVEYSTDDEATWYTAWVWAVCRDCYNYWQRLTFNLPFEEDTFALLRFRRDGNDKGSLLIDRLGFTILLASGAVPPPPPAKAIPPSPPPQPLVAVTRRDGFEQGQKGMDMTIWSPFAAGASGLIAQAETCGMQLYGGGAFKFAAGAYRQLQPATYPANASFELFINRVCPGDYSGETRLLVEYSTDDEATWYTAWVWAVCRDCYNYWQRLTFNLPFEEDTFALLRFRRDGNDKGSLLIDRLGFTILLASGAVPPPPPAKAIPPSPPPQPLVAVTRRDGFEQGQKGMDMTIWSPFAAGASGLIAQAETCGMQLYGGGAFKFAAGAYRQLQPATYPANASFELFINRVCPGDYSGETRLLVEYSTDDEATWYTAWVWAVCRDCYNYWQRLTFNLPFEEDTFALLRFRRDGNDKGSLLIDRLGFTILLASGAVPPPPPAKAIPPSPPPQPLVAVTRRDGFEQGQKGMDMTIWSPFAAGASGLIAQAETCGMQLYGGGAFKFAAGAYRQLQPATYPANASFELFINRVCPGDYSGETRLLVEYSTDDEASWAVAWTWTFCKDCFGSWQPAAFNMPFAAETQALLRFRRDGNDKGKVVIDNLQPSPAPYGNYGSGYYPSSPSAQAAPPAYPPASPPPPKLCPPLAADVAAAAAGGSDAAGMLLLGLYGDNSTAAHAAHALEGVWLSSQGMVLACLEGTVNARAAVCHGAGAAPAPSGGGSSYGSVSASSSSGGGHGGSSGGGGGHRIEVAALVALLRQQAGSSGPSGGSGSGSESGSIPAEALLPRALLDAVAAYVLYLPEGQFVLAVDGEGCTAALYSLGALSAAGEPRSVWVRVR